MVLGSDTYVMGNYYQAAHVHLMSARVLEHRGKKKEGGLSRDKRLNNSELLHIP
jgi:hypothetical protein